MRRSSRSARQRNRGVPFPVIALAGVAVAFFILPLAGLLTRAAWGSMWQDLTSSVALDALKLSLECSLYSTLLSLVLGVPLAWVLARSDFPGRSLLRALVLLPMVLPPVVGGVALLFAFGRTNGLVGPWLFHTFGIQLTFSAWGVVLAETFVAMPFLIITVEGGLRAIDTRYEDAAATLGAGAFVRFWRVTLPFLRPALSAGMALAWARALGEFGATITFAGDIVGKTETSPLAVYLLLESDPATAIALSLVLLAVSLIVLVSLTRSMVWNTPMTLVASIQFSIGTLRLDVEFKVENEIVAILGPNGAGKTTLLRALSGLNPINSGHIELDGQVLDDPALGIFVRPEKRSVGVVFQDYLLFPFLSARENVAFGLRSRKVAKRVARQRADEWLTRVGLGNQIGDRPGDLSGGQAQRVALARALVTEPRLLLLDEPLAALDAGARLEIRRELRDHLAQVPGARMIVTHDPVDASALADRVIILEAGKIVQEGPMAEIALHPHSSYVADLVGINYWRGIARSGIVELDGGGEAEIADHTFSGDVSLVIHPREVVLEIASSSGSARNCWEGLITEIDNLGNRVRVRIDGDVQIVAEITPQSATDLDLVPGKRVSALVKATAIQVYPV